MAAYISVPRDLTRVKSKVLFNLTKRQLICFAAAAVIGIPVFFLLKRTGNVSLATLGMMIVMLPLFFLGMYEKDGQPLEKIAQHFIQAKIIRPQVRPYCTNKSAAFFFVLTYIVSKNSSVFNTNDSAAHIRENFPLKRALLLCIIKATKKRRKNTENH